MSRLDLASFLARRDALREGARAPRARPMCRACRRAQVACLCAGVRPFESPIPLVLLIHPQEARSRIGTARIVERCVANCLVVEGRGPELDRDERLLALSRDPRALPLALFPGPGALDLDDPSAEARRSRLEAGFGPGLRPVAPALVLIDATWSLARKMRARSRWLSSLPTLSFRPARPSAYEFREQPEPFCLSTVEATHEVLLRLAALGLPARPAGAERQLADKFRELVRFQLEAEALGRAPG